MTINVGILHIQDIWAYPDEDPTSIEKLFTHELFSTPTRLHFLNQAKTRVALATKDRSGNIFPLLFIEAGKTAEMTAPKRAWQEIFFVTAADALVTVALIQ